MEEAEIPTETVQESVHHAIEPSHRLAGKWVAGAALTSALLAVLAAVSALLSGHHSNEAIIEQMQASDFWSQYQAKSIKALVLGSKMDFLAAIDKMSDPNAREKLAEYKHEQEEIAEQAKEKEQSSKQHLAHHLILARAVTMFQIAIAIAAIAVLMRRKQFWYFSVGLGALGAIFLVQGLL